MDQTAAGPARTPGGRVLVALVVPIILMVVATNVANATWPTLVNDHPLVLLSLSSINRFLVATTPVTDVVPFFLVATVRLMLPDPFFYLLGRWYGDRGLLWLNRRFPSVIRSWVVFEGFFRKARYPAVFIAPNNAVCLLAGMDRMPVKAFLPLAFAGTVARVLLIRVTGDFFSVPVSEGLGFVERYRWWLLGISVSAVVLGLLSDVLGRKTRDEAEVAAARERAERELAEGRAAFRAPSPTPTPPTSADSSGAEGAERPSAGEGHEPGADPPAER